MNGIDGFEVDPAIAAAMGFAGFGTQPNKKRKFHKDDGFVDANGKVATTPQGTSANSMPLGEPKAMGTSSQTDKAPATFSHDDGNSKVPVGSSNSGPPSIEALRHGVKNEHGDMAYFLPSFIEDPWVGLEARLIQAKINLEDILGYNFEDDDILREALWGVGLGSSRQRKFLEGNKMLALVGDTAMKTVLLHHSYTNGRMRWEMTELCNHLSATQTSIIYVGRANAVGNYIGLHNINTTVTKNINASTMEALLGAVSKDSGMDVKAVRRGMVGFGLLE